MLSPRDRYLRGKYGITLAQYDTLLKAQGDSCAICGKHKTKESKSLVVDHNHKTGEIRGILCNYCNHRLIGRHTDAELLHRMAKYVSQGTGLFVPPKKKKQKRRRRKRQRNPKAT